jgi:hypothetical protein
MNTLHNTPLYSAAAIPRDGTKGRRKEARSNTRSKLGVSADGAPGLLAALSAVESLRRIIDLASNGRYGLAIVRPTFEGEITQERLVEEWTPTFGPVSIHDTTATYTGRGREKSSLIHEPVGETRRREFHLRELSRNNRGLGHAVESL